MYGLLEHFEDGSDPKNYKQHKAFNDASEEHINKSLFKDKKLNKLWEKAERSGFTGVLKYSCIYLCAEFVPNSPWGKKYFQTYSYLFN